MTVQVTRASQNPPYFEQEEYDVPVNEGLMYNTTITTVKALDPDPGTVKVHLPWTKAKAMFSLIFVAA